MILYQHAAFVKKQEIFDIFRQMQTLGDGWGEGSSVSTGGAVEGCWAGNKSTNIYTQLILNIWNSTHT